MKRLDLIIDALDRVDTFDWNQQDNKLIKDARIAARELWELEPVGYFIKNPFGTWEERYISEQSTPLYALGDEK